MKQTINNCKYKNMSHNIVNIAFKHIITLKLLFRSIDTNLMDATKQVIYITPYFSKYLN